MLNNQRKAEKLMSMMTQLQVTKKYHPCIHPSPIKPMHVAYRERWLSSKHLELHAKKNPYF